MIAKYLHLQLNKIRQKNYSKSQTVLTEYDCQVLDLCKKCTRFNKHILDFSIIIRNNK